MTGTQAQESTVNPAKWLATLCEWVPTEPVEVLVALINSLIEASGQARVEGLDGLIAHTDGTTRSGREKLERLRQWSDKMRADPRYWPQLFVRLRAVSILVKKILDAASRPLDRFEVERKFRKFRNVPPSGLSQELKEMAKRGEIDRHAAGLYWRKGTAGKLYESQTQQLYRLAHDASGHRMPNAELAAAMDISRTDLETLLSQIRKRWCNPPLFDGPTGVGVTVVSPESLAVLKRDGRIVDGRGGTFFRAPSFVARAEALTFTPLRPERLPLEDAEVEAEIERLKALPRAEYEAQRESAASRLGVRLSVLDRLRSDDAKEVGRPIPQQAAAVTAVPPPAVMSRAEWKAMREASLKNAEERYFELIEAQPDRALAARAALEKKMMDDFKVTRDEARYCRAKAIKRYSSLHPDNPCRWGKAGR